MDFPLSYSDVLIFFIIAAGTALVMRRAHYGALKNVTRVVRQAGYGDSDIRIGMSRLDAVGDLADAIDVLLSRRAVESAELAASTEEFELYKYNMQERLSAGFLLQRSPDVVTLLRESGEHLLRLSGATDVLFFVKPPLTAAAYACCHGTTKGDIFEADEWMPDRFAQRVFASGELLLCDNIEHDEEYHHDDIQPFGLHYNDTLIIPLTVNEGTVGVIQLVTKKERFDCYDKEMGLCMAQFIIAALHKKMVGTS